MRIFKYTLLMQGWKSLIIPAGSNFMCVQMQHGEPQAWFMVDEKTVSLETRVFHAYGTGNPLPSDIIQKLYRGTVQAEAGALVWHIFEDAQPAQTMGEPT